jgi:hypothetical protein
MKTGQDPRPGAKGVLLSYRDWLDTCKVVAGITMPSQTNIGAVDGSILVAIRGKEDDVEPPPPLRLASGPAA